MDDEERELLQKLLEEISGIRKELKRIANYLEVVAEKSQAEALIRWGRYIKVEEKEK